MSDAMLYDVAERQHALVTARQLEACGLTESARRHRVRSGRLVPITRRVYRLGGVPSTDRQRVLAAILDCDGFAVASHATAAALWGLPGHRLIAPIVTKRRDGNERAKPIGIRHTTTHLPDHHTTIVDNLPVTYPARVLFDLAGEPDVNPQRLERLLDTMWGRSLVDYRRLHTMLAEHAARGRPGIRLMRELLEVRPPDYQPPDSGLEARVQQLVIEDGQPPLERQRNVGGADHWIGRMDFLDRDAKVVLQVDSMIHHGSVLDRARDEAQTLALEAAGFTVIRVDELDVWHHGREVARHVRKARTAGRRALR